MSNYIIDPFHIFGPEPPAVTRNAWRELGRTVLGASSSIISVNVPNVRYYMLLSRLFKTVTFADSGITVNLDGAANYANRGQLDGSEFTLINQTKMADDSFNDKEPMFRVDYLDNLVGQERIVTGHVVQQNTLGAATFPRRVEVTGKWTNVLDQISSIQVVNDSPGANYLAGSELVVLGFDPLDALDATANFWEELASVTLGTQGDTLSSGGFPARKYLWVQIRVKAIGGTINTGIQFNGDGGSNYANRQSKNGGLDTTAILALSTQPDVTVGSDPRFYEMFIVNETNEEKLGINHTVESPVGAGTPPQRQESVFKWVNTIAQITTIDVKNLGGAGNYDLGSTIKVWGHN